MTTSVRRIAAGSVVAVLVLLVSTGTASAHSGPGGEEQPATNYKTTITRFDPPPGLVLRVIDAGVRLELENNSGKTVIVPGYENEPYLRLDGDSVYENIRSPATYLNADRYGGVTPPPEADPKAEPRWRRVSDGVTARWHDHRAHWMGGTPPIVENDPNREHIVSDGWIVPMLVDGQRIEATGTTTWVPGPTGLAWFALIIALIGLLVGLAFTRYRTAALRVAGVVLLAACVVDAVGTWGATSDPAFMKIAALVTPALGFAFVAAGLVLLPRRRRDALVLLAGGAAGLFLLFGWEGRVFLTESQIPSALTPVLARIAVALALGVGAGLTLACLVALRPDLQPLWSRSGVARRQRRSSTRKARA